MAKDKERALNPAAAQRRLEKQKALKKGKAAVLAQRTTRLAARNPHRLERQIAELKELQTSLGGTLSAREKKALEDAEKDLGRVRKAREVVGVVGSGGGDGRKGGKEGEGGTRGGEGRGDGGGFGKRGRGSFSGRMKRERSESEEHTDESVRNIPMPRDTPPPIPRSCSSTTFRDNQNHNSSSSNNNNNNNHLTNPSTTANRTPLGPTSRVQGEPSSNNNNNATPPSLHPLPPKPAAQKVYESAPLVRDLRKEAVAKFVPEAVRRKLEAARGRGRLDGRLLEEEELARLEGEGYRAGGGGGDDVGRRIEERDGVGGEVAVGRMWNGTEEAERLREEEKRFARDLEVEDGAGRLSREVRVAEVDDEDL